MLGLREETRKKERKQIIIPIQIIIPFLCLETSLPIEFFLNNTNQTFLAVLYKSNIEGYQNQQK